MAEYSIGILGHKVGNEDEYLSFGPNSRARHLYVLGKTGTGKSNMLARIAMQDIGDGDGVLVLDPHGDLVEDIIGNIPERFLDRIMYWDPSDREHPIPMNIFECRADQDPDTICSEVIAIFKRQFGDSWGPLLEDLLRSDTLTMLDHQFLGQTTTRDGRPIPLEHRYNATLKQAHDILYDSKLRAEYCNFITNDMVKIYWTHFYDRLGGGDTKDGFPNTTQLRHASSTTNKLRRFLLNPLILDIVANQTRPNAIDLRSIIDQRKVLLVNLSRGKLGEDNSSLLGSLLLSRMVVAALSRADTPREERLSRQFHVIVDEFQTFATESFKLLLSEARKYGITVTIAHQSLDQLDKEMKGAALNCGSIVAFRTTGRDAEELAKEFDSVPRYTGERFEPMMINGTAGAEALLADLTNVPGLRQLIERIYALEKEEHDLHTQWSYLRERSRESAQNKGRNRDSLDEATLSARRGERAERAVEIAKEKAQIEERIRSLVPEPPFPDRWTNNGWTTSSGDSGNYYRRVLTRGTYAERERELANLLTQLPYFTALVRRADGLQEHFLTYAIAAPTAEREQRIRLKIDETHRLAIMPHERVSVAQRRDVERLQDQAAVQYEAELEEQDVAGPAIPPT